MPLRIDLLADPTFRQDIMTLITRLIRDKGDEIIRETVMSAGWLEDRVAAYLCKHPLDGLVAGKATLQASTRGDPPQFPVMLNRPGLAAVVKGEHVVKGPPPRRVEQDDARLQGAAKWWWT